MAKDPLSDVVEYLKPDARIDLKHMSVEHLVGVSATENGVKTLLNNEVVIQCIIELTDDNIEEIARNALLTLVNVSANVHGATELLKYRPSNYKNLLELLISYVLNPQKRDADAACMILSNITRLEDELEVCLDTFIPHLNNILNAFINTEYNRRGANLNYLAPMFSNLSCSHRIRKWLTDENSHNPFVKLLPFCNYDESIIRKGGAMGTVRNLSFDIRYHKFLLNSSLNLLTYLLCPLMGNEDYPDEEMDKLPIGLQYLPKEKHREVDDDVRKMTLETLNKLCTTRMGRELFRQNGVYYVLREHHKWEKEPKLLIACEKVINMLTQKEEDGDPEDLSTMLPDHMKAKFRKSEEENLSNFQ